MDGGLSAFLPEGLSLATAAVLVAVSFATSFITAAFGLGGGLILLAVMASLLPPLAVVPVHGAAQLASNAGRAFVLRAHVDRGPLLWFAAGSALGVLAGGALVADLPGDGLRLALGLFVLLSVWGPSTAGLWRLPGALGAGGFASTALTMFVGATGPVVAAILRPLVPARHAFVATHATAMVVQHGLKIAVFGGLGFAFAPWLGLLAGIVASGFAGTLAGKRLLDRTTDARFALVLKAILTLLALRLVWLAGGALTGWW